MILGEQMKMLAQHKYKKDQKLKKQRLQVEKMAKEAIAEDEKRIYRQRKYEERPDYMSSVWGRMLLNDRVKDPSDRKGG